MAALVLSTSACPGGGAGGAGAAGPDRATAPSEPVGSRVIHRGERLEAVLHGGDDQVYLIDLDGGDRLTFVIEGDAAPGACGNWGWAWHEPGGAWVTGNPLPLEPDDGSTRRTGEIPVAAEVADAGDMAPRGGRWALHVQAAPEDCAQIDYALRVE